MPKARFPSLVTRHSLCSFAVNFRNVQLPGFGKYLFRLKVDGKELADKLFFVQRVVIDGGAA